MGKDVVYGDVHMMQDGETLSKEKYEPTTEMKPVKTFEEFCKTFVDLMAVNKVEFAIYVSDIGVLPKGEGKAFSMFSDDSDSDSPGDMQMVRMATMFYSLCENLKLNTKEKLEEFAHAVALAAIRCGDKSFDD